MIQPDLIDQLLLKLEPLWGKRKVESMKLLYQMGDEQRRQRMERILSLAAKKYLNDSLLNNQVLLPPSTREECLGRGQVFMAKVCYGMDDSGNHKELYPLFLDHEDLKNHIVMTGLSGTGKTSLAYDLLIELAKKNVNCIVFDWDRTWRNLLSLPEKEYPFVKDIRVFTVGRNDISGFSWNMFFCPPPNVEFSNWLGIASSKPLQKSLVTGQGVEDFLETEAEQLMNEYQEGMQKLLPNIEDIKNRVRHRFANARQLLWKQSTERVVKELTRESVKEIFGSRKPLDISQEILKRKGITIIEMDIETPEHLRVLFQELLLTYFMLFFLHEGEAEREELRTIVFLEEFPNMLPKSQIEKATGSEIIKTMFKEARKFGLGLVAIAQETSELPNYVLANCKVQVHFSLQTRRDIEASAGSLFLKPGEIQFIDLIWRGEAIAKVKGRVKNCLVKIPMPPAMRRITDEELIEFSGRWRRGE